MTQNEQLVGAWKLLSIMAKKPNGEVIHPYGENLHGMLVYTASGHISFLGMRRDRPQFASDDPFEGTPEEIKTPSKDSTLTAALTKSTRRRV